MTTWGLAAVSAVAVLAASAAYVLVRWRRAPMAKRAMLSVAFASLIAGALLGSAGLHALISYRDGASISDTEKIVPAAASHGTTGNAADLGQVGIGRIFNAKVVSVVDGDTVDVLGPDSTQVSVRLAGIDAPEHAQAFGTESTRNLGTLISDKAVRLECGKEESYGRLICKILLPSSEDVCLDQVKAGMAWHYKQYQDEQSPADRASYAAAECAAMKAKTGLWSDPHPIQPQDFRHGTNSPLLYGPNGCRISSEPTSGPVLGNSRSHIFEWPSCPYYSNISPDNSVPFSSPQEAEAAGYRPAHNCP